VNRKTRPYGSEAAAAGPDSKDNQFKKSIVIRFNCLLRGKKIVREFKLES
jgi:hypothetical protein